MRARSSLRKQRDFQRIARKGGRGKSGAVTVRALRRADSNLSSRLGLAVRAGRAGAVGRNRIKRRLRSAASEIFPATGWDIVVGSDERALGVRFEMLLADMKGAAMRGGIKT